MPRAHRKQRGGDGFGYTDAAFTASAGMAPVESRVAFSHCGFLPRPGSLVGGARRRRGSRRQRGGNCTSCAPSQVLINQAVQQQVGGGAGTGGYAVNVSSNEMGKMYASVDRAPCPSQMGGASMADTRAVDSYSAGYGYGPESVREINSGTAHYLDQMSYGRQCMGGGGRSARRNRKGSRKAHRKGSRKAHRKSHSRK